MSQEDWQDAHDEPHLPMNKAAEILDQVVDATSLALCVFARIKSARQAGSLHVCMAKRQKQPRRTSVGAQIAVAQSA